MYNGTYTTLTLTVTLTGAAGGGGGERRGLGPRDDVLTTCKAVTHMVVSR